MSTRPRIAIPLPTSADHTYNRQCLPLYLEAIERSGGEPITIALDHTAFALAQSCSGVVLPGSPADVDPSRYGQQPDPAAAAADQSRETMDLTLLEDAERSRKPVLGICYGLQSINIWRGGSLLQDLTVLPVNHAAGPAVAVAHTAAVRPDSALGRLCNPSEAPIVADALRLPVNSSHHQAIAALGTGLRASAICPQDGVVEAIEAADDRAPLLIAVQWHPERSYEQSALSRALFDRLVHAARG